jgi:hypothetical protein
MSATKQGFMVDDVRLRAVINPEPVRIVRLGILVTIPILLLDEAANAAEKPLHA